MGKSVEDVIKNAQYLLASHKERLLKELDNTKIITEDVLRDYILKAVETVFYRVLQVSIENLAPLERREIEEIVDEIIRNPTPIHPFFVKKPIPIIGEESGT